ncbi:hypothetical protein FRC01_008663 [Tulasnella sp. 417]|nr:hypothetical protein FRC01_008663 [Tulasnella sp. 417]
MVASKSDEDGLVDIDCGWEGYTETGLPKKGQRKLLRNLRHHILNVYRRLFSIVFLVNLGVLISVAVRGATADYIGKIVIVNIFVSVLIREEHVVNGLFSIFTALPKSWPLWMRVFTARVYSLGGIHSGSAVAALMWLIYFTVQVSIDLRRHKASIPLAVITYIILAFLIIIIFLAAPAWRRVHHNKFEIIHRFLGWTVTGLVWAQVVLLIRDYKDPSIPLHVAISLSPPFWLVVILTASIASSWTHLRKVKVQSEVLSDHVFAKNTAIKLLWISRNIRKTYGDRFVDSIMTAAPDATIYDTDAHGKPDMVKLVYHVYKAFNAEAVCIISNKPLTQKVVYGLMARGENISKHTSVPAFGAIWDS